MELKTLCIHNFNSKYIHIFINVYTEMLHNHDKRCIKYNMLKHFSNVVGLGILLLLFICYKVAINILEQHLFKKYISKNVLSLSRWKVTRCKCVS